MEKRKKNVKGINEEFVKKHAKKITDDDLKEVIEKAEKIEDTVKDGGPLSRFIEDIKLLISIIQDYISGNYKEIPWWAISAIAFTLLYIINPIDLIPDFIPIIGYLDDATVVAICLYMIEQELHKYKEWKLCQASK